MNEVSQKNRLNWPRILLVWLIFFAVIAGCLVWVDVYEARHHGTQPAAWQQLVFALVSATLSLVLWLGIRWPLRSWVNFQRFLVGAAVFATVIAIFYTEEDWRAKHDWLKYKAELEARGSVLDWEKYIPPPVPDDQNFFTASTNILLRFVKQQDDAHMDAAAQLTWLRLTPDFAVLDFAKSNKTVVAEMSLAVTKSDRAIDLADPSARGKIQDMIRAAVGRGIEGMQGFRFSEFPLDHLAPAKIEVQSSGPVSIGDLENLIPSDLATNIGTFAISAAADPKVFQVKLVGGRITPAADYLKWSDQFVPEFDEVRAALQRPYAVIPGDYSASYRMPIPNFVTMRSLAQTLGQRAQCDLLLGRPAEAWHELALIHDVCRILQKPPTGKPETLVEAMINVAITGLYMGVVQEGLNMHVWQEPQLAAIQQQLAGTKLIPWVAEAFREEQVHAITLGERQEFRKIVSGELFGQKRSTWERLPDYIGCQLMPRGWVYQNIKYAAELDQTLIGCLDDSDERVDPEKAELHSQAIGKSLEHNSVFHLLANIAIPNFTKAMQTCAFNQTLANEGQIACALERYHLANGNYPETLDGLVPQYMEKIPNDIIGGQPLHYRRMDDGKFLLYSVGWNETDDGGTRGTLKDVKLGDWVW